MEFSGFDWRDGVLLLAALAAIYLLFMLLRLVGLHRRSAARDEGRPAATVPEAPVWPAQWEVTQQPTAAPAADEAPASFAEKLVDSRLDLELRQLREEVTSLRRELSELRAARRVSPQYADAMTLARRGYDAQGIADECGIAVAEAELVLAMSRDRAYLDDEVDDGGRSPAGQ